MCTYTVIQYEHMVYALLFGSFLGDFKRPGEGPQRSKERDRALLNRFERCNGAAAESKKILMADAEPEEVTFRDKNCIELFSDVGDFGS